MSASTPYLPGDGIPSAPAYQEEPRDSSKEPPVRTKTSLNITSRIERKLAQYNASTNLIKRWLFEILSVATSAICMGTIIAILASLKDQPLARWPLGLTIITILSKIASAALILPISEAIGQLKWSWFYGKKSKDAFDFEIFDKASRGAWGSVLLLLRTKGKSLAALGALLTVLLLAIDTFFQQVTHLPERWTLHGEGLIPRVVRYDPEVVYAWQSNWANDIPVAQSNEDMKSALAPFFYDQNGTQHSTIRNSSQPSVPLSCPTSVCKWSPYLTLGVCSACTDISRLLTYACLPMSMDWIRDATGPTTEHTYPNGTACGYVLNATSSVPVLMSGYRTDNISNASYGETLLMRTLPLVKNPSRYPLYDGSIHFKHLMDPILDALIVSSADGTSESVYRKEVPVAHECVLSWCVKTLRSSYSWGVYEEHVDEMFFNTTKKPYPWSTEFDAGAGGTVTSYYGNISIYPPTASHDGQGYGVSNETIMDTVFIFDATFPSMITVTDPAARPYLKYRTSFTDRVMYRALQFSPWLAPNNVTHHMERMATAMTNVARSDPRDNELFTGQAYGPETYVEVAWAWLAFPLAMLALCIIFLIATIIKTSGGTSEELGIWKTSAMPTLLYGLPQDTRHDLATASTWRSGASGGAEKVKIRLLPNEGWRVSGHEQITTARLSSVITE